MQLQLRMLTHPVLSPHEHTSAKYSYCGFIVLCYTTFEIHHTPVSCPSAGLLLTMVRWYFPTWRSLRTRSSSSTRAVNLQEENTYNVVPHVGVQCRVLRPWLMSFRALNSMLNLVISIHDLHDINRVMLLITMMADCTHLHNSFNLFHTFHAHTPFKTHYACT